MSTFPITPNTLEQRGFSKIKYGSVPWNWITKINLKLNISLTLFHIVIQNYNWLSQIMSLWLTLKTSKLVVKILKEKVSKIKLTNRLSWEAPLMNPWWCAVRTQAARNIVLAEWWGTVKGFDKPLTRVCSTYLTIMNPLDLIVANTTGYKKASG